MSANHEVCACGHQTEHHSPTRVAGRRACYLLGCPCTLYLRTLTKEHIEAYTKGVDAVLDALKKGSK